MRVRLAVLLSTCLIGSGAVAASCGGVEWLVGGQGQVGQTCLERSARPRSEAAPTTAGLRISRAVQEERDEGRRQILERELAQEQHIQARLEHTRADPDALARARANSAAIRAELQRLPAAGGRRP